MQYIHFSKASGSFLPHVCCRILNWSLHCLSGINKLTLVVTISSHRPEVIINLPFPSINIFGRPMTCKGGATSWEYKNTGPRAHSHQSSLLKSLSHLFLETDKPNLPCSQDWTIKNNKKNRKPRKPKTHKDPNRRSQINTPVQRLSQKDVWSPAYALHKTESPQIICDTPQELSHRSGTYSDPTTSQENKKSHSFHQPISAKSSGDQHRIN